MPKVSCEDSERPVPACVRRCVRLLKWNHGADSCLRYTGAMDCCHSGPCPTSSTGWWLSDRLQVFENLPLDDPVPCSYPPPSSQLKAARSAVNPVHCPHPGPLSHPSVIPAVDGRSRWDSKARSGVWPHSHYFGLAPCHYF